MGPRVLTSLVGLVMAGAAAPAAGAGADPQADCRQEWTELTSLHAENDNPRGPVVELTQRWDTLYATARQYAQTATAADCGDRIATFAATWDHLESLQYDLYRYDPMGRLAGAEGDREHALHLSHSNHLSPQLERAFRAARRQAPKAAGDLAPALAPAATVDVDDEAAVHAVLKRLRFTARHSHHQHRLAYLLRVIGNAELNEE